MYKAGGRLFRNRGELLSFKDTNLNNGPALGHDNYSESLLQTTAAFHNGNGSAALIILSEQQFASVKEHRCIFLEKGPNK